MNHGVQTRGRLAIIAAAIVVVGLVALPATALAKITTKISVTSGVTVTNMTPGTTPTVPVISAKLSYKKGSKYYSLSGKVTLYFVNPETDKLERITSETGKSVGFALTKRGEYRLVYSASSKSKYKSAKATTRRWDEIAAAPVEPTVEVTPIDDTYSRVSVTYDVDWNTEAYAGPASFSYVGFYVDDPEDYSSIPRLMAVFNRDVEAPESVEFTYRVKTAQAVGTLITFADLSFADPFVVAAEDDDSDF
jgi:hypothetical protein